MLLLVEHDLDKGRVRSKWRILAFVDLFDAVADASMRLCSGQGGASVAKRVCMGCEHAGGGARGTLLEVLCCF